MGNPQELPACKDLRASERKGWDAIPSVCFASRRGLASDSCWSQSQSGCFGARLVQGQDREGPSRIPPRGTEEPGGAPAEEAGKGSGATLKPDVMPRAAVSFKRVSNPSVSS